MDRIAQEGYWRQRVIKYTKAQGVTAAANRYRISRKTVHKLGFLRGYNAMLEKVNPEAIIVFGTPFPEMKGNIITVDYRQSRKVVR